MSTTLHNDFQKLEVSDSQPDQSSQSSRPPRPRRLRTSNGPKVPMPLRLPPNNGRIKFYGWPITDKFLRDYAIRYMPTEKLARSPDFLIAGHGFTLLRWYSRISHLMLEGAIAPPGMPADYLFEDGAVQILSVCSNERDSYRSRPAQENVDYLAKLIGRESEAPLWWDDFDHPSLYL
ncbi:hypothetical protein HYDPIDRAFT_114472 [Hydnomerulius pinastri MD-312]|uniref:Uncharacterized protein n=1 Tax=Hydnomerulius pinastri MD-312 TaxID=994086 RepID=A0A0C9VW38_9AGAM|nr:hypothetical protein HYDPIDRAFT_114472 [Hydnomerulius pinastri MD-312]